MPSLDRLTLRHRRWLISYENAATEEAVAAFEDKAGPILTRLRKMETRLSEGKPLTERQITQARRDRARLQKLMREARDDVRDTLQQRLQRAAETELRVSTRNISGALPEGLTGRAPGVDLQTLILNPTAGRSWASFRLRKTSETRSIRRSESTRSPTRRSSSAGRAARSS